RIVQYKRYELNFLVLGLGGNRSSRAERLVCAGVRSKDRKQVAMEHKTEDSQQQDPANPEVRSAQAHAGETSCTPAIFHVAADSAWCPLHACDEAIDGPLPA